MTKSEIFKKAHEIARKTVSAVGDYMIAFSLALKSIYQEAKKMTKTVQEKLADLGLQVWERGAHRRIYINDQLEAVFGLSISSYKTGNISGAKLNGEKISNSQARRLVGGNPYYDCNTEEFVGIELEPII